MSTATLPMHDHDPSPIARIMTAGVMVVGMLQGIGGMLAGLPWSAILGFLGMVGAPVANHVAGLLVARWREGAAARLAAETLRADVAEAELIILRPLAAVAPGHPLECPRTLDPAKLEPHS